MKKRTLIICLVIGLITSCTSSVSVAEADPQPIATETPKPTPTLTPEPTLTPTPTFTPTPTSVPTPSNLNQDMLYKYETIDPYKFYIEEKGYIKIPKFNIVYEYLDKEKGDDITGNSKDGWYITYKDQTIYYGPGKESADGTGTEFEMWVGKKESGDVVNIIQRKKFFVLKGSHVTTYFRTWYPGPPGFVYYPAKSSFILVKREDPKQNYSIHPAYSPILVIMVTPDNQILTDVDTEKWPEWCGNSIYNSGWATGTVGYTIDGELFYWGKLPDGEMKCPILKIIEE